MQIRLGLHASTLRGGKVLYCLCYWSRTNAATAQLRRFLRNRWYNFGNNEARRREPSRCESLIPRPQPAAAANAAQGARRHPLALAVVNVAQNAQAPLVTQAQQPQSAQHHAFALGIFNMAQNAQVQQLRNQVHQLNTQWQAQPAQQPLAGLPGQNAQQAQHAQANATAPPALPLLQLLQPKTMITMSKWEIPIRMTETAAQVSRVIWSYWIPQ